MDLVCMDCGKIVDNNSIHCTKCTRVYCSPEHNLKNHKEYPKHCEPISTKLLNVTNKIFHFGDGKFPAYKDKSLFPVVGPIDGYIPHSLYRIDSGPGKTAWDAISGGRKPDGSIFYLVHIDEWWRVFWVQFTEDQRDQYVKITQNNTNPFGTTGNLPSSKLTKTSDNEGESTKKQRTDPSN